MTTRRLWIAGLGLGVLGVALAVLTLNSRSRRPDVQILFMGYSNVPASFGGRGFEPNGTYFVGTRLVEKPVLLVTNCGSVPVQVLPIWEAYARTNIDAHRHSYLLLPPLVLKPGESVPARLSSGLQGHIFRAELAYQRLNFARRMSQQARSSTNAAVRAVARLIPRPPKPRWARSEPITNSVRSYVTGYHITAPPPPVTYEMLFAPRK